MFTALFRTFDHLSEDVLNDLLNSSLISTPSERITDLTISEQDITLNYFHTIRSFELFYDFVTEVEVPKTMDRAYKASCIILKNQNRALIYGSRTACSKFENYVKNKAQTNFSASNIKLNGILGKLSDNEYHLRNIEYLNVEFLGTVLKSLSLEFKTNMDAKRTLKDISVNPSKVGIEVIYNRSKCVLNIDIVNSIFEIEYDSIQVNDLEKIKEMIINYFEEE